MKNKIVIAISIILVIGLAIYSYVDYNKDTGKKLARQNGYTVKSITVLKMDETPGAVKTSDDDPDGFKIEGEEGLYKDGTEEGSMYMDTIVLDNGAISVMSSTNKTLARKHYKMMKDSVKSALKKDAEIKETKSSYCFIDEGFYYLGSYKDGVFLQATATKDNLKEVEKVFKKLGHELP